MSVIECQEPYILEEDGCYVDETGVQHYLFARELDAVDDDQEQAIREYVWHLHPEWQGQYEEGQEVEQDWDLIKSEVERLMGDGFACPLFPRYSIAESLNQDWDKVAYFEWRWYQFFAAEASQLAIS